MKEERMNEKRMNEERMNEERMNTERMNKENMNEERMNTAGKNTAGKNKLFAVRCILISTAVVLITFGIINEEYMDVLRKAVRVCLECIGIG